MKELTKEQEEELGFRLVDEQGHYQILPGRILDYLPLRIAVDSLRSAWETITRFENERNGYYQVCQRYRERIAELESERDTYKRSHEAMDKLEEMVKEKSLTLSLYWDGQIVVMFTHNESKLTTAPTLIEAIEKASEK
jgi:hypothetical protein